MELLSLAAAGIVAALCAVVVRQRAPEIAFVLAAAACLVLLWNTLPLLETIRDVLRELADLAGLSPTILRPLLQTVGLALVTKLAAALCRDAGEGSVAAFVETAGAAAAVLVALPLLKMVLELIMGLL
ncbi:MAG TPA: stage III sporulation protein AD [Candidatus Evtepia faecigallinarum]|nr:stage III sporulation protein AD [Candidatus Evtepia faecigallinarum]